MVITVPMEVQSGAAAYLDDREGLTPGLLSKLSKDRQETGRAADDVGLGQAGCDEPSDCLGVSPHKVLKQWIGLLGGRTRCFF